RLDSTPMIDYERAAARHAVRMRLLAELAGSNGRERLRFLPRITLAVRVERDGHNADALVRFGLVVARFRARPTYPARAEHDRDGGHRREHGAASGSGVEVVEQTGVTQQEHAGLDVAAPDEHEIDLGERLAHAARIPATARELRPMDAA